MKAYKGFNEHLQCDPTGMKPFQYEIGGDYEENSAMVCRNGFHACENPMDVFSYYAPGKSRYCEVEVDNISKGHDGDTKVAGTKIHIGMEIGIKGIIKGALNFIFERVQKSNDTAATTGKSLPPRGAWIEIFRTATITRRTPKSPPPRGAWIEIIATQ